MIACGGDGGGAPGAPVDTGFAWYTSETDADADADTDADTDGTACVEAWSCTPWETDGTSDDATRTCVDLNACGTTDAKPVEDVTLPALDPDFFRCNVEPILDRTCSHLGCHGTESGRALRVYARGRLRVTGETFSSNLYPDLPSEDCIGSIEGVCWSIPHSPTEDRRNYDAARGFALDLDGELLVDATASELLTQPTVGGPVHANVKPFVTDDADYTTVRDWLEGAALAACHTSN